MERTFIMIKPDGVQRGLVADIIKRFEQRGYKLVAMKMMTVSVIVSLFAFSVHKVIKKRFRSYLAAISIIFSFVF